jgi:hypothetical protein
MLGSRHASTKVMEFGSKRNMEVKVVAPCAGEITRLLRLLPGSKASKPVKKGEALLSVGGKTVSCCHAHSCPLSSPLCSRARLHGR